MCTIYDPVVHFSIFLFVYISNPGIAATVLRTLKSAASIRCLNFVFMLWGSVALPLSSTSTGRSFWLDWVSNGWLKTFYVSRRFVFKWGGNFKFKWNLKHYKTWMFLITSEQLYERMLQVLQGRILVLSRVHKSGTSGVQQSILFTINRTIVCDCYNNR